MRDVKMIAIVIVVLLVVVVAGNSVYTVSEIQQAVITQFGDPKRVVKDAGLHFKVPIIEQVNFYEKRILEWDGNPTNVPTLEKQYIQVDTFARWRIEDPLVFRQKLGIEDNAQGRLDDIINGAVRNQISNNLLIDAVRSTNRPMKLMLRLESAGEGAVTEVKVGRDKIMEMTLIEARSAVKEFGIELIDVRIKRIDYKEDVRQAVYQRMIAERQRIAAKFRSEGEGEAMEIEGSKEKDEKEITSEAYKQAEEIRGKADAEAIKIYAAAYSNDPEFYSFLETLKSYETTLGKGSVIILSTDSDYLKYLKSWGESADEKSN